MSDERLYVSVCACAREKEGRGEVNDLKSRPTVIHIWTRKSWSANTRSLKYENEKKSKVSRGEEDEREAERERERDAAQKSDTTDENDEEKVAISESRQKAEYCDERHIQNPIESKGWADVERERETNISNV